ncbi:MAG: hypothetical protein RLY58_1288 [Pseudomonadota bacterium]|jgi:hypothetical protein
MSLLSRASHLALELACLRADQRFEKQRDSLESVQRQHLNQLLKHMVMPKGQSRPKDYESFAAQLPLTRYKDWKPRVEAMRQGDDRLINSPLVRFQPTSGSSESIKFIPYTKLFLGELDAAIGPWLSSMYRLHPKLKKGFHYWSVSWLPESQREVLKGENLNDDSALLDFSKRILTKYTQAVPSDVAFAAGADDALFATLCYMVSHADLSMISVWSPTFALQLLDNLQAWGSDIAEVLQTGSWGGRQASLAQIATPKSVRRARLLKKLLNAPAIDPQQLWPHLALVSSWDTAGAVVWAEQLRARLPHAGFEGKGLWATEGVVTFPYNGEYPLAYQSHFYEFENLTTGEIVPSWALQLGDHVSPILSCGNGLMRYCMDDHLLVSGFYGSLPCFTFQGRRFGVDLVGEKLDPSVATQVMQRLGVAHNLQPVSLLAVDTAGKAKPYYVALFEGNPADTPSPSELDQQLRAHFHYELARDLGQLECPQVYCVADGWAAYKAVAMQDGMIEGNIKPEPLKRIQLTALQASPLI